MEKEKRYTVEFISDCFLHGADGKAAVLRVAPIKALFRFYFRVLEGKKYNNPKELQLKEKELFGGVFLEEAVKSKLKLWIDDYKTCDKSVGREVDKVDKYLGYGLSDKKTTKGIECFPSDSYFVLGLSYPDKPDEYDDLINKIITLINLFGGIGGRSRKGYGSIFFHEKNDKPKSWINDYLVDWNTCYSGVNKNKDYPWTLGRDEKGFLAWQSKPYDSLSDATSALHSFYCNLRKEYKNLLGYTANKDRLASPLVFKYVKDSQNKYIINCIHFPYYDILDKQDNQKKWKSVHEKLDSSEVFKRMVLK